MKASNRFESIPIRFPATPPVIRTAGFHPPNRALRIRSTVADVNIVIKQPGRSAWDFEHPWSRTLCSCFKDMKQCCYAFCCPWCFECQLQRRAGEHMCTCLCPGARFALRTKLRTAFRIEGDLCSDCLTSTCCPCCTMIQLSHELHYQGF